MDVDVVDLDGPAAVGAAFRFVQWLEAPADPTALGGKAGPLATLLAAGLPVPPGFVVTPRAFRQPPPEGDRAAADPLHPEAAAEIRRACRELARRLGTTDPPLAVRSSGLAEDLPGASFAGQYETCLHVRGEEAVLAAVARCWASLSSAHALAYRRHQEQRAGTALPPPAMAVLVQALVAAEAAGVAFTAHPASGDRSAILVNAAWGLGQSVVAGEVEADSYRLDRQTLALVERRIGSKSTRTGAGPGSPREAVPEHLQRAPCLTDEQAAAVARLALRAEQVVGGPLDVEWALLGGTVWLLQARPITALPVPTGPPPSLPAEIALPGGAAPPASAPPPDSGAAPAQAAARDGAPAPEVAGPTAAFPFAWPDERAATLHWRLGGEDGRRPEVLRPLEQDVRAVWYRSFQGAAVVCGWPSVETPWYVNGYEYVADVANPRPEQDRARAREALEQVGAALAERGESYRRAVQFPPIDAGNARLAAVDVAALAPAELAAHLSDALDWYERLWTLHWTGPRDGPAQRFVHLYRQHAGAADEGASATSQQALDAEARELLSHEPNLLTEAIDALIAMARTVQQHPALRGLFQSATPEAALAALPGTPGGEQLRAQLDQLLAAQGLRSGAGFGTERNQVLPGWRERPALVLGLVQRYLSHDLDDLLRPRQEARDARDRRVAELLARLPDEAARAEFSFWLAAARRQQQAFEDHNYKIDSAGGALLHRAIAACAGRLVAAGVLAEPDEVWWLRLHEIALALDAMPEAAAHAGAGTAGAGPEKAIAGAGSAAGGPAGAGLAAAHWPALLAARRAEFAWRRLITPAPALGRLALPAPAPSAAPPPATPAGPRAVAAPPAAELPAQLLLSGEPGSRGVATGRVRLAPPDDLVPDLAPGDVLVAPNAGPLWTPLFPVAAAVVLDQGALFQHAMLTCREYGVPAVFQTKDATRRLREGMRVTVDGTRGWVLAAEEG